MLKRLPDPRLTIELPDELTEWLTASGQDLSRAAPEAVALEAYLDNKPTSIMTAMPGLAPGMIVVAITRAHSSRSTARR